LIKGALIGFAVTLACSLIPIVHFVTIWPGPFIGGFIGGSYAKADQAKALWIGLVMGIFMLLPAVLTFWVLSSFLFPWDKNLIMVVGGIIFIDVAVLGSFGAVIGGRMARRSPG